MTIVRRASRAPRRRPSASPAVKSMRPVDAPREGAVERAPDIVELRRIARSPLLARWQRSGRREQRAARTPAPSPGRPARAEGPGNRRRPARVAKGNDDLDRDVLVDSPGHKPFRLARRTCSTRSPRIDATCSGSCDPHLRGNGVQPSRSDGIVGNAICAMDKTITVPAGARVPVGFPDWPHGVPVWPSSGVRQCRRSACPLTHLFSDREPGPRPVTAVLHAVLSPDTAGFDDVGPANDGTVPGPATRSADRRAWRRRPDRQATGPRAP